MWDVATNQSCSVNDGLGKNMNKELNLIILYLFDIDYDIGNWPW